MIKKQTKFKPIVLSRHPSHRILKENLIYMPFRSVIRLGSTTTLEQINTRRKKPLNALQTSKIIELNSIQGIKNSSNKLLMKQCFEQAGISTADWTHSPTFNSVLTWCQDKYPIIAKHKFGSRGTGNKMINNQTEFNNFIIGKNPTDYIFEKYYTYTREYRIHVTKNGYFYTCRKMLKRDTPEEKRFQRHDDNCVWYTEDNSGFDKPVNWNLIVQDCVKALNHLNLDIAGFDIKVQSSKNYEGIKRTNPKWIIIESNSACSFGTITAQKYLQIIPQILKEKWLNKNN